MECFSLNLRCFPTLTYIVILGLCIISSYVSAAKMAALGNETDLQALLDLKSTILVDPLGTMDAWNASVHHCKWQGLICSPSNQRVTSIDLSSRQLVGLLPPSIGNLSYLTAINLRNNSFRGELPQQIGRLRLLQNLNLTYNSFTGGIPTNLTHCTELRALDLVYNHLVGRIPESLSSLLKLKFLGLGGNFLTGGIPAWIGNFTSMQIITMALNSFHGNIPPELGSLSSLRIFQVYGNQLSGTIPPAIYNLSNIYYFSVTQNQLHGKLPQDVGLTLPNLEIFAGGVNNFTGKIPVSLSNLSNLAVVDFAENGLTGKFPSGIGKLQSLYRINFDENKLGNGDGNGLEFLSFLSNCTNLQVLGLNGNSFGGKLPDSVANLSLNLNILTLGSNLFYGELPDGIGNLKSLTLLGLEGNLFTGSIPNTIGKLTSLQGLHMNYNSFSGLIPSSIGNLTSLTRLFMEENKLEGTIPAELGSLRTLLVLNLTRNNLTGIMPREVIAGLSSLSVSLAISQNLLTGSLPDELGKLVNLNELDLSQNKLSGEIPNTLSKCLSLERLILSHNLLRGSVPESLKSLRALAVIDLSHNNLSGEIPGWLIELSSLRNVNFSFNNFVGEVPSKGIFANESAISLTGNGKLCGGIPALKLPRCRDITNHTSSKFRELKVLIPVIVAVVFLIVLVCVVAAYFTLKGSNERLLQLSTASSHQDWQLRVSFQDILKSTNDFSEENLIGSGSFGSVYKGVLHLDGPVVAVKKLNLQQKGATQSFMDECRVLRNTKHRNLLKIVTACSSIDHQGNDFKCIVFEYMENGNLDQWLHPVNDNARQTSMLDILQRLNIAIDVASALDYLHNYCEKPIVHCDLKPSNILLDEDMTAHVGDFGLATFLFEASIEKNSIPAGLKGSIGYIPPEYGSGSPVSASGDVYSYGILLLELFTGKRPTHEMFQDGLNIHRLVATALPGRVMEIVDPSLLMVTPEGKQHRYRSESSLINNDLPQNASTRMEECLVSVLNIGMECSNSLPMNRMPINIVVNRLQEIRDTYSGLCK